MPLIIHPLRKQVPIICLDTFYMNLWHCQLLQCFRCMVGAYFLKNKNEGGNEQRIRPQLGKEITMRSKNVESY